MKAMRAPYHKSEGLKHSFTVFEVFQPKMGDLPKYQIRASRELPRATMQPAALPSMLRKTEGAKVVQLAHTLRCSIEQPLTIGIPQLPVLLTGSLAPLAQAACGRRLFSLAGTVNLPDCRQLMLRASPGKRQGTTHGGVFGRSLGGMIMENGPDFSVLSKKHILNNTVSPPPSPFLSPSVPFPPSLPPSLPLNR